MHTSWTARIAAACAALVLAAVSPAPAADYRDIHSIGVVSVIGSEIMVKGIGVTVFTNNAHGDIVSNWNLDAGVTQWITIALSPRFTVKSIAVAQERWIGCEDVLQCVTDALPSDQGVDAFIVVHPTRIGDPLGTNQDLSGLGLYRKAGLFGDAIYGMYAMYAVTVIDARTGEEIDGANARLPTGDFLGRAWPWVVMEEQYWPARGLRALDDARRQTIETRLTCLVELSLPMALHGVGLMKEPETVDSVADMVLGKTPIPYFGNAPARQ